MQTQYLILDDNRGIYIPKNFAEEFDWTAFQGVTEEQRETLLDGPDGESYWDVWEEVTNNLKYMDKDGNEWTLFQDGAVWFICAEEMTEEELENL